MIDLAQFKALTFDCYGTLIDWETGILNVLRPWADDKGFKVTDEKLLEDYAQAESRVEEFMPGGLYSDLLKEVMNEMAAGYGVAPDSKTAETLAMSVGEWPAFDDTAEALSKLKKNFKLAIISNVDRASFARSNERLGVTFDAIITAEDAGAYKPDTRPFLLAFDLLEEMGVGRSEILHVAQSLFHDHVPAKALGLATVWVDRRRGRRGWGATPSPQVEVKPDLVVANLAELAKISGWH
ncbi:MAG TPA: haloacid dehalogenase type II [Acidobacteriota bacterium]|nr:haloacid dehalogenase type II [Acidobacteriota bacterium]